MAILRDELVDQILSGENIDPADLGELDRHLITGPRQLGPMRWIRQGRELVKEHVGRDFADSIGYVNAVAGLAESANHHPDISINWNVVTLRLTTHFEGGLTARDIDLARRIDGL